MATSFPGGGGGPNGSGRAAKADGSPLADPATSPQNIEAGSSVLLGSILLDNEVLHEIITFLRVDDFYRDAPPGDFFRHQRDVRPATRASMR